MAITNAYQLTPKGDVIPKEVAGRVIATKYASTSYLGNPSYWVTLDNGETYRTMDNSGLAYGITNPEYRETEHTFTLTRAGRIRSARRA